MRTRYAVRKILPPDDYAATELVVHALRELLYERAAHERVLWATLRVDVEALTDELGERVLMYARIDVETPD
jgi:hypothetical protein